MVSSVIFRVIKIERTMTWLEIDQFSEGMESKGRREKNSPGNFI